MNPDNAKQEPDDPQLHPVQFGDTILGGAIGVALIIFGFLAGCALIAFCSK